MPCPPRIRVPARVPYEKRPATAETDRGATATGTSSFVAFSVELGAYNFEDRLNREGLGPGRRTLESSLS